MPLKKIKMKKRAPIRLKSKFTKGLNKVEKKQVSTIINRKAETKYFQVEPFVHTQKLKWQSVDATKQEIQVRGFTVGPGGNAINNVYYGYSTSLAEQAITPLHMSRTFLTNSVDESYRSQVPEGKTVMPSSCSSIFRLHRYCINSNDTNAINKSPTYVVRFIRVRPKALKYGDVTINPRLDLFQNVYGVAYGIDSPSSSYQRNFGLLEMMTMKLNSRKYTVIEDKQFNLDAALNYSELNGDEISTLVGRSEKLIRCTHKQPKKLHYTGTYDTNDAAEPTTSQSNEMIFIHVGVLGKDSVVGNNIDNQIKIDVKAVATFKDI